MRLIYEERFSNRHWRGGAWVRPWDESGMAVPLVVIARLQLPIMAQRPFSTCLHCVRSVRWGVGLTEVTLARQNAPPTCCGRLPRAKPIVASSHRA